MKSKIVLILIISLSVFMFGFGKKNNNLIEVKFVENGKDKPFAVSEMPIEQLPDTFEIDTTLDIGNDKWTIVNAIPIKKEEFMKTGKLSLFLSKVELMNPKDILFSLPSINDVIGSISKSRNKIDQYYKIHEDDWRQIELVSNHHEKMINNELNSIIEIYNNFREEYGFKKIHVRKEIIKPLEKSNISLTQLKKIFGTSKEFQGLAYEGQPLGIDNSYAFISNSGVTIWGESSENGSVRSICFSSSKPKGVEEFSASLLKLLNDEKLYLIDWCRVQKINDLKSLTDYYKN